MQNAQPILLYNDECGVCRRIARWVRKSAPLTDSGAPVIVERPIGDDPVALRALNSRLNIWDAYETIHLLMPDGSMKVGGEAVAEVLRALPKTKWIAGSCTLRVFGHRPFQSLLNLGYAILSGIRPLFGCESCGTPGFLLRPVDWTVKWARATFGRKPELKPTRHFTPLAASRRKTAVPAQPASTQIGKS